MEVDKRKRDVQAKSDSLLFNRAKPITSRRFSGSRVLEEKSGTGRKGRGYEVNEPFVTPSQMDKSRVAWTKSDNIHEKWYFHHSGPSGKSRLFRQGGYGFFKYILARHLGCSVCLALSSQQSLAFEASADAFITLWSTRSGARRLTSNEWRS